MVKKAKINDIHAWLEVTQGITPITTNRVAVVKPISKQRVESVGFAMPSSRSSAIEHNLHVGDKSNIDRHTIQKIDSGKYPIDESIDLHGFTQEGAFLTFERFILSAIQKKYRLLLVIVGKGEVLSKKLPLWVNTPNIRPFILRISIADSKNGGKGAFFIFLKRNREHL